MTRVGPILLVAVLGIVVVFVLVVPPWHLPVKGTQIGYRASSMIQWAPIDPSVIAGTHPPPALPPAGNDTRPATAAFHNVKVLTDIDVAQFMRLQQAMTAWVSPTQGCGFCHAGTDYASDAKPAKLVARLMLTMTRHVNGAWRQHVAQAGVTCDTCHRGQPVPSFVWFPSPPKPVKTMIDKQEDWQESAKTVRKFFPTDAYDEYLLQNTPGLAQSYTALPTGQASAQIVTKRLYEMMMQMSDGIGVNCGFCHNSRAFFDWSQSTPYRWTGYSGITMTRDINRNFLLQLGHMLPEDRLQADVPRQPVVPAREQGPQAGNGLANCATCHHGAPKPLGGADMVDDYPGLVGPAPQAAAAAIPPPHG
jgi:photosynthetic reaction center cytochrome c subunit